MRRLGAFIALSITILLWIQAGRQTDVFAAPELIGGSGHIEYLGQGGAHTVEPGVNFIVKRVGPFKFEMVSGPTFTAAADERVWSSTGGAPQAHYREWVEFGSVSEGCRIKYLTIDDDPDDRVNKFYINGEMVHDLPQGMVASGEFYTTSSGNLRLYAEDSIGIWISRCTAPTETPPAEPTNTPTLAPPTNTPGPTSTATATPTGTFIPPTETPTPIPPTATDAPPNVTTTPTVTATATKKPRLLSCLRINFEQSGHSAKEGIYEVRELGGRLLYVWYAQEGWQDSGWIHGIDISFEDVFVEVFYLDPTSDQPIRMKIINPAPGTPYGWLSRGICHSIEVGWPDVIPNGNGEGYEFGDQVIWPGQEPTPTPTPASSLRG